MFVFASWLHTKEVFVLVVGIPWIAAMAWSRWYKHCHNVPQIVGGLVTGAASAVVYSTVQRISS